MPLRDVLCAACGEQAEILVRNGETPVCHSCGSEDLVTVVSRVNVHFKGPGWAKDLYSKPPVKK